MKNTFLVIEYCIDIYLMQLSKAQGCTNPNEMKRSAFNQKFIQVTRWAQTPTTGVKYVTNSPSRINILAKSCILRYSMRRRELKWKIILNILQGLTLASRY